VPSVFCAKLGVSYPIGSCYTAERRLVRDREECSGNAEPQSGNAYLHYLKKLCKRSLNEGQDFCVARAVVRRTDDERNHKNTLLREEVSMRNNGVIILVECALGVALAVALQYLAIRLPINFAGGSISFAMLPIGIVALRRGAAAGALMGAIFGMFDLLIGPYIVHWAQVLLDYPVPYLLFGAVVGLFARPYAWTTKRLVEKGKTLLFSRLTAGSIVIAGAFVAGGALRYASHVLSGVIFFSEYAEGGNVWAYSFVYNIAYLGPSLVVSLALALIIVPILAHAVPSVVPSLRSKKK